MANPTITIDVDEKNETFTVHTTNFVGKSCDGIHKAFESMGKVLSDKKSPEYYGKDSHSFSSVNA
jgi:hypothetical protein